MPLTDLFNKNKQEQTGALQGFADNLFGTKKPTYTPPPAAPMSMYTPPQTPQAPTQDAVMYGPVKPAPTKQTYTPAPSPTPVAPTPEPTLGQTYKDFKYNTTGSAFDTGLANVINQNKKTANTPVDENKIRRDTMQLFQAEIDAVNEIYAQKLAEARQQGLGNLGSSTAIQARSGLLGSDFGQAQTQNVQTANNEIQASINAEKAAKIGAIMGTVRSSVAQEIADKRKAQETSAANYLDYLSKQAERNTTKTKSLAAALLEQGLTPEDLDPTQLEQLATDLGVTPDDIVLTYNTTKQEKEQQAAEAEQKARFTLGEGQAMYDSKGNVIAARAKTYAPSSGGGFGTGGLYDTLGSKGAAAVIKEGDKFASQPIVKKYNELISAANFINAADPNTQNAASHQAIVYNFAKMLDPDSVVREGEYATVKKYSQSLISQYGGELKQAISGKGFLSPGAIQAIQAESQNRVKAYEPQYTNIKTQYKNRINNLVGQDVGDQVLSDYEEGYSGPSNANTDPEIQDLLDQGYTQEQIQEIINAQ